MGHVGATTWALVAAFATASCSNTAEDSGSTPTIRSVVPATARGDARNVLFSLRLRDEVVTARSTERGIVYDVLASDGARMAEGLSLDQLRADHPDAAQLVTVGHARSEPYLDSRMDPPAKGGM